jgi:hypothetical protein
MTIPEEPVPVDPPEPEVTAAPEPSAPIDSPETVRGPARSRLFGRRRAGR